MKLMKKMLVWVMMLTLMTMGAWGAMAEQADAATDAADSWYEISADGTVVTVRLPLEAGLSWTAEISDDTLMELITEETENDLYVASFKAVDGQIGDVSLIFNLTDDTAEAARRTRVLEMTLGEGGQLNLLSVLEQDPEADWCELTDNVLTVRLPEDLSTGYRWDFEISDPEVLEMLTQESTEGENGGAGQYAASFRPLKEGQEELVLSYSREDGETLETRAVDFDVDAQGNLSLRFVDVFTSWSNLKLLRCGADGRFCRFAPQFLVAQAGFSFKRANISSPIYFFCKRKAVWFHDGRIVSFFHRERAACAHRMRGGAAFPEQAYAVPGPCPFPGTGAGPGTMPRRRAGGNRPAGNGSGHSAGAHLRLLRFPLPFPGNLSGNPQRPDGAFLSGKNRRPGGRERRSAAEIPSPGIRRCLSGQPGIIGGRAGGMDGETTRANRAPFGRGGPHR